ncbi:MAG: hypothetical protein LBJ72_08600 [Dysgonamonadaceae bacterium]|nr:hypothetical protein [Dysgonamonadaceae bacterium]
MLSLIRKSALIILLYCYVFQLRADNNIRQGLHFYSFEVDKDKRTCLDLTPEKPLKFPKGFSMEFDVKLKSNDENFGYIFRILGNDSLNIDLISDVKVWNTYSMIIGRNTVLQFTTNEIPDYVADEWIKVRFSCNTQGGIITLDFNGAYKSVRYNMEDLSRFDVFFGGNLDKKFSTTDVPPMVVKNIRLFDEKQTLVRNWELGKHGTNCVYDFCKNDKAVVMNPLWEIDNHAKWDKLKTFLVPDLRQQTTFDPFNERIFIVKNNRILVYHIKSGQTDTVTAAKGIPFNNMANQLVYDKMKDHLVSYDFNAGKLARFDFKKKEWNNEDLTVLEPNFWHHGKYFRSEDSTLVTMGGYGFHKYSGLLQKYSGKDKKWEQFDLSQSIAPRYLAGFGNWKDSVFLYFGGYGNESGDQRESPQNYYDLYTIDTKDFSVKKSWELENNRFHFTNGNSLIVNEDKQTFYVLSYPNKKYDTYITLHEFKINSPEFQILGDSIPYFFNDVESYCDLMKPNDQSQLVALTVTRKGNDSEVNIYTIAYPPLSLNDIHQILPAQMNNWFWTVTIFVFVALFFIGCLLFRKRKISKRFAFTIPTPVTDLHDTPSILNEAHTQQNKFPSISLLGDFNVVDRKGNNISNGFTPTTRQVFLLILLLSIKNKQGISSSELRNILWYDKDGESARNNRNVYINKLRILLKNVGDIKILSNKGYWCITLDNTVFCDYERVLSLISALEKKPEPDKFLLNEMLDIAGRGKLLPFYEQEWLDDIKTDYSNRIIEFLLKKARLPELKDELVLLLKMAEVILLHDDIEENGIRLKCRALFRLDKKKQALTSFNKFSEEHVKLLGIETKLSFEEIVK